MNVYCWEIGLLSAATAHAAVPPAIGQVSLSELFTEYQVGLVYTVTVLLSANNLCSGSDILCHRYVVEEGDTLAGIALRYQALIVKSGGESSYLSSFRFNITIQDLKQANKLWTNEGLWPGKSLRIPHIEVNWTKFTCSLIHCDTGQRDFIRSEWV